jgi:circadian clock protein KaiB
MKRNEADGSFGNFDTEAGNVLPERVILRLYVAGASPRSVRAIENIRRICQSLAPTRYALEVINLYQNPSLASEDQIVALPTLIKCSPLPVKKMIGDLSNGRQVLRALGIA